MCMWFSTFWCWLRPQKPFCSWPAGGCGDSPAMVTILSWCTLDACSGAVTLLCRSSPGLRCTVLGPQTGHPGTHLRVTALLKAWGTRPLSPHYPMELSISHISVTVFPIIWMPEIMLWQPSEDCNENIKHLYCVSLKIQPASCLQLWPKPGSYERAEGAGHAK